MDQSREGKKSESIRVKNLSDLLQALNKTTTYSKTFCPLAEDGVEHYRPIREITEKQEQGIEEILFRNHPPLGSLKSFLFPDTEMYLQYKREGKIMKGEELKPGATQIIMGVKSCDLKAIALMDQVFLAPPIDTLYRDHKEKTLIIATACHEWGEHCNCGDFGIKSSEAVGADILLKKVDNGELLLENHTAKGAGLLQELLAFEGIEQVEESPKDKLCKESIKYKPQEVQEQMDALFKDSFWETLALRCISCGSCTYYCPTCHCYDIQDFSRKDRGGRYRTWDSCMFSNFTNMAGDHNPRPTKTDRIKNRFYHKLNYFVKKQGDLACVGCGRCAELCPVGISINTVLKKIGGSLNE